MDASGWQCRRPPHRGNGMSANLSKTSVVLAGVTTAAAAAAVVGHMFAIDWFGRKLREYVRQP